MVLYFVNTMASTSSTRVFFIAASLLISAGFVGAAYIFSGGFSPARADAQSTEQLLKEYAEKDSDNDELPDWQEVLYGSDPEDAHSIDETLTDREAVDQGLVEPRFRSEEPVPVKIDDLSGATSVAPGTVTDRFARVFFEQYLLGRQGVTPSSEEISSFAEDAVNELTTEAERAPSFTIRDVNILSQGGSEALRTYAVAMQTAILGNMSGVEKDELAYFHDIVTKDDARATQKLNQIATAYANTVRAIKLVAVPPEAAAAHVKIVTTAERIGTAVADMAAFKTDPLRTMVGLGSYDKATDDFAHSLTDMGKVFDYTQMVFQKDEAGAYFYGMLILGTAETIRMNDDI